MLFESVIEWRTQDYYFRVTIGFFNSSEEAVAFGQQPIQLVRDGDRLFLHSSSSGVVGKELAVVFDEDVSVFVLKKEARGMPPITYDSFLQEVRISIADFDKHPALTSLVNCSGRQLPLVGYNQVSEPDFVLLYSLPPTCRTEIFFPATNPQDQTHFKGEIMTNYQKLCAAKMQPVLDRDDAVRIAEKIMGVAPASYHMHAAVTVLADALLTCADMDDFPERVAQLNFERFDGPDLQPVLLEIGKALATDIFDDASALH